WIIFLGCKYEGRATSPPTHQLCRNEFLFFSRLAVPAKEFAKQNDVFLEPAICHVAAIAGEHIRLWQIRGGSVFIRIPEDELARLQGRPGAWCRFFPGTFNDRL